MDTRITEADFPALEQIEYDVAYCPTSYSLLVTGNDNLTQLSFHRVFHLDQEKVFIRANKALRRNHIFPDGEDYHTGKLEADEQVPLVIRYLGSSNAMKKDCRSVGQNSSRKAQKKDMIFNESLELAEPTGLLLHAAGKRKIYRRPLESLDDQRDYRNPNLVDVTALLRMQIDGPSPRLDLQMERKPCNYRNLGRRVSELAEPKQIAINNDCLTICAGGFVSKQYLLKLRLENCIYINGSVIFEKLNVPVLQILSNKGLKTIGLKALTEVKFSNDHEFGVLVSTYSAIDSKEQEKYANLTANKASFVTLDEAQEWCSLNEARRNTNCRVVVGEINIMDVLPLDHVNEVEGQLNIVDTNLTSLKEVARFTVHGHQYPAIMIKNNENLVYVGDILRMNIGGVHPLLSMSNNDKICGTAAERTAIKQMVFDENLSFQDSCLDTCEGGLVDNELLARFAQKRCGFVKGDLIINMTNDFSGLSILLRVEKIYGSLIIDGAKQLDSLWFLNSLTDVIDLDAKEPVIRLLRFQSLDDSMFYNLKKITVSDDLFVAVYVQTYQTVFNKMKKRLQSLTRNRALFTIYEDEVPIEPPESRPVATKQPVREASTEYGKPQPFNAQNNNDLKKPHSLLPLITIFDEKQQFCFLNSGMLIGVYIRDEVGAVVVTPFQIGERHTLEMGRSIKIVFSQKIVKDLLT
uniref:Recep_L_domain domain-containing protein n=1 Tax=Angiostrongylus cantonensis TaxID=6313 RepID=A0A158PA11_ANGCA